MRAIILGGVAPHIELIKNLKNRGYETLLVDYNEEPPAKTVADRFFRISTLDYEVVKALAIDEKVDLIITVCVDHANVIMCKLSEELNLPHPYSYETALLVTNKNLMKKRMKKVGVPTADFQVVGAGEEIIRGLEFPLVVKPVDNNGSKGISRADSEEELQKNIEKAFSFSRAKQVIVEEFNEGKEIQVDCFANEGHAHVLMVREKLKIQSDQGMAMQSFGSLMPPELSGEVYEQIRVIAQKIADGFELEHTPFFFQAIVKGNKIRVLELTPRIGGGLSYKMLKNQVGFDVIDAAIDSYFGNLSGICFEVKAQFMLTGILYANGGVLEKVTGIDKLLSENVISQFDFMSEKGKAFPETVEYKMDSRNRVGAYIIIGETYREILDKSKIVQETIDIMDPEGKSIMCKIFYHEVKNATSKIS